MARKQNAQLALEIAGDEDRRRESQAARRDRGRDGRAWGRRVRRALFWISGTAAVTGAAFGLYRLDQFLASDDRFALDAGLIIEGVVYAPRERVESVFARDVGRSVYLVPLSQRRRSLMSIDWVRDAAVSRRWPNRIAIRITERTPVAFLVAPGGGAPALIDAEGAVLSLPPRAELNLPALMGITREQTREAREARLRQVLEMLRDLNAHAGRISEIDAADLHNLKITFSAQGRAFRLWLGNRNYGARLANFLKYYGEIGRRMPYAQVFDLRLDDRITVPSEVNPAPPAPAVSKAHVGRGKGRVR